MYLLTYERAVFGYYDTGILGIFDDFSSIEKITGTLKFRKDIYEDDGRKMWMKCIPREDDDDDFYFVEFLEPNKLYNG